MKNLVFITALMTCAALPTLSHAGEKEDQLIDSIVSAYGGDALTNMRNYHIFERYLTPAIGQSHTPALTEVGKSTVSLLVETSTGKAVIDRWGEGRAGAFQGSTISDGTKAHNINYQQQTYGDADNADAHIFAGGTMRTADTILAYELNKVKNEATLGDDESYLGRPHHVLTMPFPQSPDLHLYVDAKTYLISKMVRKNPNLGNLDYVFSDYKEHNGIRYASSTVFTIAGTPTLISTERTLKFNQNLADNAFALPTNFKAEGERIDASEMDANKLSSNAYHVGANGAFSLFIDTSMGIVAAGGYAGLANRFQHFQKASDNHKPLSYQIVTHHHSDHIGGLGDAISLGAKIVTVSDNIDAVSEAITPTPDARDFYTVGTKTTFGEGRRRVDVYEVSTIHSESFLLTYVPADKLIFIADHYGSPFANGTPNANQNSVDMLAAIDTLKIDVKKISTAHNKRIFTMKNLRDSVAAYKPVTCLGQRPVCS